MIIIILKIGKPLHKGYLYKTGFKIQSWHKRYFIIYDNNEIRYFEKDDLIKQKGKIELNSVTKISVPNTNKYQLIYIYIIYILFYFILFINY